MPKKKVIEQEWSYFIEAEDIDAKGTKISIAASEEERRHLSSRLSLEKIDYLEADLTLARQSGSVAVHVQGSFRAKVTQICVVTLEPFDSDMEGEVEGWFADRESTVSFTEAKRERDVMKLQGEIEITDERDDPEPMIAGMIDVGELVVQHLSLALPAYPKKEGASHDLTDEDFAVNDKSPLRKNPFEALKDWKEQR